MTSVTGSVAAGWIFPVEVLMKSAPPGDREEARAADVVVRAELARLEDHLEVGVADGLLDLAHLLEDLRVVAGEEGAPVDDHVDLVRAGLDGATGLLHLEVERRAARREGGGDGRDLDVASGRPSRARRR